MDENTRLILAHAPKAAPRWEDEPHDGSVADLEREYESVLYSPAFFARVRYQYVGPLPPMEYDW